MSERTGLAPSLWAPSTQMGLAQGNQELIVRGEGAYLYTGDGRRLFDGTATLWFANIGHGRADIAEAAARQMRELETHQIWSNFVHPRVAELSERLTGAMSPIPDAKVMFGSGGSDSGEMAFRLARLHWRLKGQESKVRILARHSAYHGLHAFGTSLHWNREVREAFGPGPLVADTGYIDRDDIEAVRATVLAEGPENIAALVAEPIIGAGGVYPPTPGYLAGLRALCDEFDILLIFDEVVTGFGRTGEWFASQRYEVVPDLTMFAKGITCGYIPLGGVFAARKVWEPFWSTDPDYLYTFGVTYAGHATACAVALAVLDVIEAEGLLDRVRELEKRMLAGLSRIGELPYVSEVRGEGLMAAVKFDESVAAARLAERLRTHSGMLVRPITDNAVVISPPFITTDAELDALLDAIARGSAELVA
ncbi:MAG TPA: aminotransferase class III-fold pyridoxal phosphate-dependent enzyme [Gryllotalpicola sp.]